MLESPKSSKSLRMPKHRPTLSSERKPREGLGASVPRRPISSKRTFRGKTEQTRRDSVEITNEPKLEASTTPVAAGPAPSALPLQEAPPVGNRAFPKKSPISRQKSDAYLRAKVKTASGGELVIMLYEKAISNLNITCDLLAKPTDSRDYFEIGANIRNAQDIILELLYSLDMETGGEFARKMSGIYTFINRELSDALIEQSAARIKPILSQLEILLGAWRKAHEQLKTQEHKTSGSSDEIHLSG